MANRKWLGAADAVAQVETFPVTAYDAATTYIMTINGDTVSVLGDTDVDGTALALQVALAASSNPYFSSITWTVATDTVTGTATSPGNPFTATASATGGAGTIGAGSVTTTSSGPNDWDVARNWDGGVPVNGDSVIIEKSAVSITRGLDQSAVTLAELIIRKDFTGRIGLKELEYATTTDGATTDPSKDEYQETYLKISSTVLSIGENFSSRPQSGSSMVKINLGSIISTVTVHETATTSFEASRPAVQLLGTNASNKLFVRAAKASVGVSVGAFEVSTFSDIEIGSDMATGGVILGSGATITNWQHKSGTHFFNAAATVTLIDALGGEITTEGDYTVTTMNIGNDAVVNLNHVKTAGNAVTTLNFTSGGELDTTKSSKDRTLATVNTVSGAVIKADKSIVTITTLNLPAKDYELSVA